MIKIKKSILGAYLKQKRVDLKLSQYELGEMLSYNPQFISNWERGISSPPVIVISKLITILNIPQQEILEILTEESINYWKEVVYSSKKKSKSKWF